MKVLMQGRADLFDKPGGDLIQMQKTQQALQELNITVQITNEVNPDLASFDVVHLYNISRIHETYSQLRHAKQRGLAVVLSPIYHKIAEIERYERLGRTGILGKVNHILRTTAQRENFKNGLRLRDGRQRSAILSSWGRGFTDSQKYVLEKVDCWVTLAEAETKAITEDFGVSNRAIVAKNAVDKVFFDANPNVFSSKYGLEKFVMCVGRIEDRKNQINLIKSLVSTDIQLVFVGGINPHHATYVKEFEALVRENRSWVHYLGALPYTDLPSAYAAADLHVLPSWFEVVSLTVLESAASGCQQVVADTGYMREYLGDDVEYCDPGSNESIRLAVKQVRSKHQKGLLQSRLGELTWEETARQTVKAYESAITQK